MSDRSTSPLSRANAPETPPSPVDVFRNALLTDPSVFSPELKFEPQAFSGSNADLSNLTTTLESTRQFSAPIRSTNDHNHTLTSSTLVGLAALEHDDNAHESVDCHPPTPLVSVPTSVGP